MPSDGAAYGLLTVLLGLGNAGVVLALGQLFGQGSSLAVAGATLAVAVAFQPARRSVQQTMQPAQVWLWLRPPPTGVSPERDRVRAGR